MIQDHSTTAGTGDLPVRTAGASTRPLHPSERDRGITLVEIVMAIVLSSIVGAVIVAALTTSLNAANNTTSTVASSIDTQLITTFLTADAMAAGGIDPLTAALDPSLGVSVLNDVTGWAGCTQSGTLAVRFAWDDRSAASTDNVVVTYALLPDGSLARRTCDAGGSSTAVLGRGISDVTVSCSPLANCTGLPERVSLQIEGGDPAAPFDVTLDASLRAQLQTTPSLTNAAQAPLVITGTSTCPVLTLGPTSVTRVLGDVIVDAACGASPISGVLTSFGVDGALGLLGAIDDPLASMSPPASCSGVTGTNPTIGSSTGASSATVYPNAVTITGNVTFQPGHHVFCNGLTIGSGATVDGTGVLLHVASGAVTLDANSTVTLAPPTSGPYAGIVLWAAGTQDVTITGGAAVDQLSGIVYTPRARLTVAATSGVRLGGVIAERVAIGGTGPVRIGLPIPTLTVAAGSLPIATVGLPYTATAPAVSGGTAPFTYSATGLPSGLVMTSGGAITGVPLSSGTATVSFLAIDATGASVPFTRTISVSGLPPAPTSVVATAGDTTALLSWTPGLASGAPATTGYTVTATAPGFPTSTCTGGALATSCTLTGLTNGITYSVSVTATNAAGTGPSAGTTVVARPAVLVGTGSRLWLDATDPDADGAIEGTSERCNATIECTGTGNVLTRWEDKSGSNNDAVQTTATMAGSYVPNLPAVDFDANGFYEATVSSGPDMTAFVVAQSDTTTWNTWGWLLSSRRPNGLIIHPWPGGTWVGWYATNSDGAYLASADALIGTITSPRIYDHTQAGSNPIVATSSLDGFAFRVLTHTGQTRTATSVTLRLGADDTDGRLGNGKYREVIVFSRALSAAERRAVQEYLGRKWGVAITPSAPTAVSALAANGGALVSWTAPAWNGGSPITSHRVTAWPGGATCTATAPATSCAVTGLTNGTAYAFIVEALNTVGTGAPSAQSNTITPGPPPAPTTPIATGGNRQAAVSWTAPTLNGHAPLTGYTVTATASGQTTRTCATTAPATTCTVTGLTNDVTYTFAVVATNAHGNSPSATTTGTAIWTPAALGSSLTWWFDANDPASLTGAWTTRSGLTLTGTAGATRVRVSAGVVERIDVVAAGTGYTSTPSISTTGGGTTPAAGSATMSSGSVARVTVQTRGSGFTTEPTVVVSGGGGSGAVLRARIIADVTVGSTIRIAGQTYTVTDRDGLVLTISPPLAADATATAFDEFRISTWANRAVPGVHDARQPTAARQPVLGTMAGRTAVAFSGLGNWLSVLDPNGTQTFDHHPNWTVLVAYQADRQVASGAVGHLWNAADSRVIATAGGGFWDWASSENILVETNAGTDSITGGPVRVGTDTGNGSDTFDWNRVVIGEVGSSAPSEGWGITGRIGEIIFVNGPMDSQAVADATAYLTAKWAQSNDLPSAPINVTATPGDGQTTVEWRASNPYLSSVSGYTVTASAAGQTTRTCTTTGSLNCTLTGLTNGAPYTVTVTATSTAGTGPSSVPITVVTRPALLTGSNSRVWLDAADIDGDGWIEGAAFETNGTGAAGSTVQTWTDKSGRANHTNAPTVANRPTSTAQTINGLPVITFNGSTILQGASAVNPYGITGDRTLFVVTRRRSGAPSRLIDRTPEDSPLFDINGDNRLEVRDDNGGQYQPSIGSIGSTPNAVTIISAHRSGNALGIWSNAVLSGTATMTGTNTQRALTIGRHVAWSSTADLDVAEVILFDRTLTEAERRTVEEYLSRKWGSAIAPANPTALTAVPSGADIALGWTAPASNGGAPVTDYAVEFRVAGSTTWTTFADGVSTATTATITGLTAGTSYDVRVSAVNTAGTGPGSAVVTMVPWTPAALGSTNALWFDAATASTFTLSGSSVSQWNDRSPWARNAAQGTSNAQPTVVASAINGRPAVSFDGNDVLPFDGSFIANADYTVAAAVARTSAKSENYYLAGTTYSGNANLVLGWRSDSVLTHAQFSNDYNMTVPGYSGSGVPQVHLYRHEASTGKATWIDGTSAGSSSNLVPLSGWTGSSIGRYAAAFYVGMVGEIVITRSALSVADRQALEGYLAWKWGTEASLPAGHPYRSGPPRIAAAVPGVPASPSATPSAGGATVSWTNPVSHGSASVASYTVTATATGQTTRSCTAAAPTTTCALTGMTAGVAYSVAVTATNAVGTGSASAPIAVTPT